MWGGLPTCGRLSTGLPTVATASIVMRFSYNWLRELVEGVDTPPAELARWITVKTAECEGVEEAGADHIIEVDNKSLTHRPDLWGHHGMAREVAAILSKKLLDPVPPREIPGAPAMKI